MNSELYEIETLPWCFFGVEIFPWHNKCQINVFRSGRGVVRVEKKGPGIGRQVCSGGLTLTMKRALLIRKGVERFCFCNDLIRYTRAIQTPCYNPETLSHRQPESKTLEHALFKYSQIIDALRLENRTSESPKFWYRFAREEKPKEFDWVKN